MQWLILLAVVGAVVAVATIAITALRNRKTDHVPHPSELSSESRSVLRGLRQSAEGFEKAVKANPNIDASQILGGQALDSVRKTVAEASRMMANRDLLKQLAQRLESQGNDPASPLDAIDRIDRNIADATSAIDALTLQITQAALSNQPNMSQIDSDLPDLVNRLQNVSRSFDEVSQHLDQNQLS